MQPPDPLPAEFAEAFASVSARVGRLGRTILFFSSIPSTNDAASALASLRPTEGAIVIADMQTAGRGRRGRVWFSPPGAGLYVSVVLDPEQSAGARDRAVALLTLAAGVAIAEGIERATGLQAAIKWPNDLTVGGRKLAGILAEGIAVPSAPGPGRVRAVVLGYGINIAPAAYPAELADRATSIEFELGRPVDRGVVCAETIASLAARYDDLLAGRFDAILGAWHQRAPGSRGATVSWDAQGTTRTGVTAGLDSMGALLVVDGQRTERLIAGEVTWA